MMRMPVASRRRTDRARPRRQPGDLVAATLAGLAGALHLWLTPAYAAQGARLGAVFLGLALGQLAIAIALALAPGPAVRAIGRWGSLALAVAFLAARVVPLAWGGGTPERLGRLLGPLSLLLEVGALAALALLPPARGGADAPRWAAGAIALVYVVLQVVASGGVIYARQPFAQVLSVAWRPFGGDSVAMYPGLHHTSSELP